MASSRIKGIAADLDCDTTKLQSALKGVNSEIKNTQAQLKDVNKLLKLDPGNTELLAQKHKLLGDAVSETKEKLETLKTAAEQANTALANCDISQEQYDALQREIVETENELKNLETQANESATALQKISATGEKLQTVGSKISSVGQSLLPVSAAVTGLGVAGLKVVTDFETAMSEVKAITGATGEDFEKLREEAIDLGASTAFSSQEVAAGMTTEQIIDGMSGVLSAAAALGSELSTVSTIVADAITGFGLAASDSTRVADLLTQAANTGTIDIEDLGESFKYVAPLCSAMGFSIEDATTALAAMSTAGIKGPQAGTSLGTAFLNMASPTDAVAAAMDKIGLTVTDTNGNFKDMDTILSEMRSGEIVNKT